MYRKNDMIFKFSYQYYSTYVPTAVYEVVLHYVRLI